MVAHVFLCALSVLCGSKTSDQLSVIYEQSINLLCALCVLCGSHIRVSLWSSASGGVTSVVSCEHSGAPGVAPSRLSALSAPLRFPETASLALTPQPEARPRSSPGSTPHSGPHPHALRHTTQTTAIRVRCRCPRSRGSIALCRSSRGR